MALMESNKLNVSAAATKTQTDTAPEPQNADDGSRSALEGVAEGQEGGVPASDTDPPPTDKGLLVANSRVVLSVQNVPRSNKSCLRCMPGRLP